MKQRNEIPAEFKWDFTHMFADQAAWEAAYNECEAEIPELAKAKGTLGQSAEALAKAFDDMYAFEEKAALVMDYAFLAKAIDGGDANAQTMMAKVVSLSTKASAETAFLMPELMEIPEEKLAEFMNYEGLKKYAHIIEDATRLRAHVLDEKSEAIIAQFGKIADTPSDTYDMMTNVEIEWPEIEDEKGEKVRLTSGNFGVFRESKVKAVRDAAFVGMFGTYGKFNNTFATVYGGSVKQDNLHASLRGYESARRSALAAANVPDSVYDSLIAGVHAAIPSMEKYLELRKKALGLEKLDVYDLYAPMVSDVDWPVSYEEAKEMVLKAVAPLGEEYVGVLTKAFDENWIDVYETPGKESGAFSAGIYGVHPYVKLNFAGQLDDAFTLAHELGHSMHSYLSSKTQDFANHDYTLLVAEVASTVNEVLLTKYLLSVEKDPQKRAYVLNHFLEGFRTTIFRQTLFAEFEWKAHELEQSGQPITADVLNEVYENLEKTYYPNAEMRDEIKYEWSFIPHFYRAFYVYVYATGFSSAVSIASHILESGDASAYLRFLSTGGSDYPINELKIAGIDLTSPSVVESAMKMFDETIEELKAAMGL